MPVSDRLVYLDEKATPEFWDARWRAEGRASNSRQHDEIIRVTSKYLPLGACVLEGGCGRADKVRALADAGFKATGIDFAKNRCGRPGSNIRIWISARVTCGRCRFRRRISTVTGHWASSNISGPAMTRSSRKPIAC